MLGIPANERVSPPNIYIYIYTDAQTPREICPKTCQDPPRLVLKGAEGDAERIERKMYPSSMFIDSS